MSFLPLDSSTADLVSLTKGVFKDITGTDASSVQTKASALADKVSGSKRNTSVLTFPSDLNSEESGASILFNINVPTGSQYLGKKYKVVDGQSTIEQSSSNSLSRKFSGRTSRIATAINLWVPGQIRAGYSADWNKSDLASVGAMMDAATSMGGLNMDNLERIWGIGKTVLPDVAMNTTAGVIQAITPFNVLDAKNWYTNQVNNPYMEMIFNGVAGRSFSFTFKMIPRNAAEAETIRKICYEFKFHQAPEYKYGDVNLYWTAPSEFDIKFLYQGEENSKLFKISTCALTSCEVTYGSDGGFDYYHDGTPAVTTLQLTFQEMELLTKNRIESGY
jgi:hypothetical protein